MAIVRSLAVFALVVASVIVGSTPAGASHSWGPYHWGRTANPFTLQLGDNVDTNWDGHLSVASTDWTVSTVLDTTIVPGSTTGRKCRASLGTVQVCNAAYGFNGWLGLAQIWIYSDGHIAQGLAKMNDTYFNLATYNNPNEKLHVMCQEIGHTFGLDHQSTSGASLNTCMDYFSNTGTNATSTLSTRPNQHDYDQLVTIYGHNDLSSTFKSAQSSNGAGRASPTAGFAEDGTPAGASRARGDVYVTDLGGGRRIVTFITWAR